MRSRALTGLLVALALPAPAATLAVPGAQGNGYAVHLTSLKDARFRNTIRQHYDFSCGSAATATLLTYQYGYPMDERWVFEQMYAHGDRAKIRREGFSLLDIKRFLHANGFEADGFHVALDKLRQSSVPAIVLLDEKGYHHFVVVKGLRDDHVLVGDPARGTRAMSRATFEAAWPNKLVFVIHNRRSLAVFNNPDDWRAAPLAALGDGIDRRGVDHLTLPARGPGDI